MALGLCSTSTRADESEDVMEALQSIQEIVGEWGGSGKFEGGSGANIQGWDEKVACTWKFNKSGKVSLYLTFADKDDKSKGRLLDEGMITFDPEKKTYLFRAYKTGGSDDALVQFEGKPKTKTNIVFDRIEKGDADDQLDRFDLKILNDGDRLVYAFQKRLGKSKVYRPFAQMALDRTGTSLAGGAAKGPKCIVTGGAGLMTVSHDGKTVYVCCTGCRDAFLANPAKYLAKLKE